MQQPFSTPPLIQAWGEAKHFIYTIWKIAFKTGTQHPFISKFMVRRTV